MTIATHPIGFSVIIPIRILSIPIIKTRFSVNTQPPFHRNRTGENQRIVVNWRPHPRRAMAYGSLMDQPMDGLLTAWLHQEQKNTDPKKLPMNHRFRWIKENTGYGFSQLSICGNLKPTTITTPLKGCVSVWKAVFEPHMFCLKILCGRSWIVVA